MKRAAKRSKVSHERWLVSYADFITLLFAFFVVLFATGQSDKKKAELAVSIQAAFSQMGIFDLRSKVPLTRAASNDVIVRSATPLETTTGASGLLRHDVELAVAPEIRSGLIAVRESPNGLVISLDDAGFFDSGTDEVRPATLPILHRIADSVPNMPLRVEGHTDDVPIHTLRFASNWELSTARASCIARLLLVHPNIHAEQLSIAGYAQYHPMASNATAVGRARNRRVDIVLLNANR